MPITNPYLWPSPLGSKADVSEIPTVNTPGSGKASIEEIFSLINEQPLAAGGKAPERIDFNALFKLIGEQLFFLQNGGVFLWSNTLTYQQNAIIMHDGILYQSQLDNNINNKPSLNSAQWKPVVKVLSVNNTQPDNNGNISLDFSNFAKLDESNTFSGTNTFNGNTITKSIDCNGNQDISGTLTVVGKLTAKGGVALTGTCTAPTPGSTDDSTKIATTAFVQDLISKNVGCPTGTILAFMGTTSQIPKGWLYCNGAYVEQATYPDLYAVIGTKFGSSGTKFRLPILNDNRFLEGHSVAGTAKNAGLPNIMGSISSGIGEDSIPITTLGAFSALKTNIVGKMYGASQSNYGLSFNASQSNSLYGATSIIQPKSLTSIFIIKT